MILTKENIREVNLEQLIDEKIKGNKIDELLLIVPTNRKVRNLKKEIISKMPEKSAAGINIETLGTLSSRLLKALRPFKELSEAAATVFLKQSAEELKPRYFSIYNGDIPFGTLDRIKNVISEYKRHGITPILLRAEAEKLEKSEKLKALDIADIYEIYLNKCFQLNVYELGDIYNSLNSANKDEVEKVFKKLFDKVDLLIINGFNEFSQPEIEIIDRITSVKGIISFLNFDYDKNNKFIFEHIDLYYERLEKKGFKKIIELSFHEENSFKEIMRTRLFRYRQQEQFNYKDKIYKIAAQNRENEVELISREIKNIITDFNIEPSQICVAFNLIQNYSSIVRDIFQKNGIPINLSDRITLSNSNPVTAIINFLEIAESDYYYQNIFRAVNSGFIKVSNVNYSNLFKVASELKIVSGKEKWINTISESLSTLKHLEDEDEEELNQKISSYNKALADIKFIIDLLKPFEGKYTIAKFLECLQNFIINSRLPEYLLNVEGDSEKNIRGFSKFIDIITEVFDLLEIEYGNNKTFGLNFFLDQMRTACGWARFNVKEKSNFGVQITSLDEIRGIEYDYLFIGGLCDGDLPARYQPEIFFSGSFKKKAFVHQTEERNLFYQALNCWKEKLYLTYPAFDNQKELVTSSFLNDFESLFIISELTEKELNKKIYSKEDYQVYVGENDFETVNSFVDKAGVKTDRLQKVVEVELLREKNIFSDSTYTGILFPNVNDSIINDEAIRFLKAYNDKQYSISQLETYSKCPFKYFLERILNIQVIEEPSEDIEAVEMGRILHSIFYEFYTEIRKRNIDIRKCNSETFDQLVELIYSIAERNVSNNLFNTPITFYEKEKLFGIEGNREESILSKFLDKERNDESGFIPKYFEVSFGKLKEEGSDTVLSFQDEILINGIKLRGKIDRIEVSEKEDSFNIVDYKLSGKKPTIKEFADGISLQLPVYLYAAGELLYKKFGKSFAPNEMIIYSLKYSEDNFGKIPISVKRARNIEINSNRGNCPSRGKSIKIIININTFCLTIRAGKPINIIKINIGR